MVSEIAETTMKQSSVLAIGRSPLIVF